MTVPEFYKRILVVDDEPAGIDYIRQVFTPQDGYDVIAENNIYKVMDNWHQYKDRGTIFIDVFFNEEVLGPILLRYIKQRAPERFVVMISAKATYIHDYVRFIKMGADSFLEKSLSYLRLKIEYERFWKKEFFLNNVQSSYVYTYLFQIIGFDFKKRILFFRPTKVKVYLTKRETDFLNLIFTLKQEFVPTTNMELLRTFNIRTKSALVLIVHRLNKKFRKYELPISIKCLAKSGYYLSIDDKSINGRGQKL